VAADVALSGTTAFLAATRYPEGTSFDVDSDAAVAQTFVYDTLTGATATWESPFPGTVAAAIDASPSGAIFLMTRRLPPADPTDPAASPTYRLAMARLNADGSQAWFTTLPAGGDMEGRAVVWTVDGAQYATAAVTSAYGLGGPEVLYSRFNGSGTWGGGPSGQHPGPCATNSRRVAHEGVPAVELPGGRARKGGGHAGIPGIHDCFSRDYP
jgi:hypothetical protein